MHDAVIVGSGAGGGAVAWRLAAAGWQVLVLEKGPRYSRENYSHGAGGLRPGAGNKRPAEFTDYCKVGPTRVPFLHFPEAELAKAKRRAAHWMKLNEKYRPLVEAQRARSAA